MPIDDDELRSMLEARGDRHAIDLRAVAAEARRDALAAPRSLRRTPGFRAALAGLGSIAAIALVLVLVVVPLSLRPTPSAGPAATGTGLPSTVPTPTDPAEGPAPVVPLSVEGLSDWLAGAGSSANGRVVLVDAVLVTDPTVGCTTTTDIGCSATIVRGARTPIVVDRIGGWDAGTHLEGTFALRGTDRIAYDGGPAMDFLGELRPVNPRSCGRNVDCPEPFTWTVPDLIDLAPAEGPDLFLVEGWLVRTSSRPCPSPGDPYACPTSDILTPDRVQPTHADGSSELPAVALRLPSGTYDAFAAQPAAEGAGVVPRPGTFLVQRVVPECATDVVCGVRPEDRRWVVQSRVDPIAAMTPSPGPAPAPARYAGGIPTMVNGDPVRIGLDAQARWRDAIDSKPFLVGGWFDSRILNSCSGGLPGNDPNPLASRTCPRYTVDGLPGRPFYPESVVMPDGDGAIVLRVHTRDGDAEKCLPATIDECRSRVVVEQVVWFGAEAMPAGPLGPREAISRATGVFVAEWRPAGADSQTAVDEDIFTVPIACPAPWPTLVFSIHGDPRYGLVAVFPDTAAREGFQAATAPDAAGDCLADTTERPAGPRWVGHENVLALTYGDDTFVGRLAIALEDPDPDGPSLPALPMTEPELDRSLETTTDYLLARSSGQLDHAWGERLGDEDYLGWTEDVFRRYAADALVGRIEALDDEPTIARVGPDGAAAVQDPGVARARIYRVTYPDATDLSLAMEEFLVIQVPESEFRDWQLIRIAGEPYPAP